MVCFPLIGTYVEKGLPKPEQGWARAVREEPSTPEQLTRTQKSEIILNYRSEEMGEQEVDTRKLF